MHIFAAGPVATEKKADVGLKRSIGLMSAINIIIGVMIGSGIFVSPTSALRFAGSVWFCLIVWVVCGLISLLGALCFAELGTVGKWRIGDSVYYTVLHLFNILRVC